MLRSVRALLVSVLLAMAVLVLPTAGWSPLLKVAQATAQASGFHPMSPVVVLDTAKMIGYTKKTFPRPGTTTIADLSKLASLPKSGNAILAVQVAVRTAVGPVSVKVFSTGSSAPSAPQIMAPKGSSATTVLIPYSSGRTLSLRISGSAHIAVSLSGWFSGDSFSSSKKSRLLVAAQRKNERGKPVSQTLSGALPVSVAGASLVALRLETNALTAGVITISQVLTAGQVKEVQIPATKVAVPDGSSTQHILVPVVSGAKLKVALPAGTASTIDLLGVVTETAKFSLAPLSATILLKKEVSSVKVANGSYLNGTGSAALLVTVKSKKATSLYVYPHKQARPVAVSLAGPSGSFTRLLFVSPGSDGLVDIVTSGSSASVTVKSLGSFNLPSGGITPAASFLESSAVISSSVVAKDGTASATIAGTLRPGSVVVLPASAEMPNGYIGRVLTSTSVGDSSTVTMEAGSFLDVMPTSALDINLDTGDITLSNQGGVLAQGVGAMSSAPKSKRFEAGCEGSVSAGGKLEPTFSYDLGTVHIESGGWLRPYVELYLQPYVTAAFTASVSAGIECKLDAQLGEVPLPTITGWVFFIPVIWSHEIRFNLIGNFKASISASYELSASASAKLGVRMGHDSEVYRSAEFKTKSAPAWEAVADGSLWLNAEYKGGLYGALGLIAGIGPELSLNVDAQASPWLSLRAAIKGSISGFASIGVADWETDPLTFVAPKNGWKIWEIGKPPTPTTTTTTVAPVTTTTVSPGVQPVAVPDVSTGSFDTNIIFDPLSNDSFNASYPAVKSSLKLCSIAPREMPNSCTRTSLEVAEEGTYTVNANGTVTFDPLPIFVGVASPVTYMVGDTLGRYVNATITPTILGCSASSSCVVGDVGPGGGRVFYVASSNFSSPGSACGSACKYLEAAPIGWYLTATTGGDTECLFPGSSTVDPRCVWSSNTTDISGATGIAIGAGYANTSTMISLPGIPGKAGTVARAFRGGGKTDWSLPSKNELIEMAVQRLTVGFTSDQYWSSSEGDASNAWNQYVNDGFGRNYGKGFAYGVRPIRAF